MVSEIARFIKAVALSPCSKACACISARFSGVIRTFTSTNCSIYLRCAFFCASDTGFFASIIITQCAIIYMVVFFSCTRLHIRPYSDIINQQVKSSSTWEVELPCACAGGSSTSTVVQDYATGRLYPFLRRYARPKTTGYGPHLSEASWSAMRVPTCIALFAAFDRKA